MPEITEIVLHYVGNKSDDEGVVCSKNALFVDDNMRIILQEYFQEAFMQEEQYHFVNDTDLKYNEVCGIIGDIFEDPDSFLDGSISLAKHLYEKSNHPKIKPGEFYVVRFSNCMMLGNECDAIGLFKTENRDTFLKVWYSEDNIDLTPEQGINTKKLDKGCLIYNIEPEDGYVVTLVDNTNRSDARFWVDEFLQVMQTQNEYANTHAMLSLTKNFVTKELPQNFEVSKADQADLLNRSVAFFKDNDHFNMEEFAQEVIGQPEVIESFQRYKNNYEQERDINIDDDFSINNTAVKKQARIFKSVIKLDTNFHIYVHGNRDLIEQGEDDKGKFYKVYYNQES